MNKVHREVWDSPDHLDQLDLLDSLEIGESQDLQVNGEIMVCLDLLDQVDNEDNLVKQDPKANKVYQDVQVGILYSPLLLSCSRNCTPYSSKCTP